MHAEVIAVGDELTSGERLDTNSQWLSQQLAELGVRVLFHTTVGDDLAALVQVVRNALQRAPLVLVTGGLGPTADDLTRDAIAQASDAPLELDEEVFSEIETRFTLRGRRMPRQNRVQAMFPRGSRVIPNPHGTAPGIDQTVSGPTGTSRLFALPGVPAEMIEMWHATVRPAVAALVGPSQLICHHRIKCFGVGESHLESMLPDLIRRDREPRVGITVHRGTITLRITSRGPNQDACREQMVPTIATIRECLGELVFGEEDDELEHVVLRRLSELQQRIVIAEWGTAGLVAGWVRAADGDGRLIAAISLADGPSLEAMLQSSVHHPAASELVGWTADHLRTRFGADYALVVGPLPDEAADPPRIQFGLASANETRVVSSRYGGHPDIVLDLAAKRALDLVRLELFRAPRSTE